MPQASLVSGSPYSVDYTPGSAVAAGDVVVRGDLVGVAPNDIAANALGALQFGAEFEWTKATGGSTAITVGTYLYWDDTNDRVSTSPAAGANKCIGVCTRAAGDNDTVVRTFLPAPYKVSA